MFHSFRDVFTRPEINGTQGLLQFCHRGIRQPIFFSGPDDRRPRKLLTRIKYLRIIICLRRSEVVVEGISFCNVIEKLMEHDIHCLPGSCINDVIDLLSWQLGSYIDFILTSSGSHAVEILRTQVRNSIVAMVTDLWCHLTYNLRGAWHTVYAMLHSNYK